VAPTSVYHITATPANIVSQCTRDSESETQTSRAASLHDRVLLVFTLNFQGIFPIKVNKGAILVTNILNLFLRVQVNIFFK
jgi:hypothetical protein